MSVTKEQWLAAIDDCARRWASPGLNLGGQCALCRVVGSGCSECVVTVVFGPSDTFWRESCGPAMDSFHEGADRDHGLLSLALLRTIVEES